MTTTSLADPESGTVEDLVDVDRYPLHRPRTSGWTTLVERVRTTLADDGLVSLPGFLTPTALAAAAAETAAAVPFVPIRQHEATVYHRDVAGGDAEAPWNRRQRWHAGHVTRDMIAPHTVAHRLYASSAFKVFVAACVGRERVYEYADPLAGLVATVLPPGGEYGWHYDTNEFVVTIMTRRPEAGGRFVYRQDLRTPGDENLEGLGRVLCGQADDELHEIDTTPGDLQLFLGRYSLHRITPVGGDRERHVLVFSYADRPGVIGPVDRTRSVYGRVTEAHLLAEQLRDADSDGLIL